MIEIWQECANFERTSQRLADQVRTIIKKASFSDLEILEIHQKTNKIIIQHQTHQVLSNKNNQTEMNSQLRKIKTPQPSNSKEKLTQEQTINLENVKIIMMSEKTTVPSL